MRVSLSAEDRVGGDRRRFADKKAVAGVLLSEEGGDLFNSLVFDQLAFEFLFKGDCFLMSWQQRDGLDIDQPCSHFQESRADFEVGVLHLFHIREVLFQQFADFDVGNFHFMPGDQMEQQFERPFEFTQPEFKRLHQTSSLQMRSIQPVKKSRALKATERKKPSGPSSRPTNTASISASMIYRS